MLSAGGVRQQFSVKENILMGMYGASFIKSISSLSVADEVPDVQFHENGYLFLATNSTSLAENHAVQRQCGVDWVDLYAPLNLKSKFPWLNIEGLGMGSFSSANEGYFDPWSFVKAMKNKVRIEGVDG